MTIKKIIYLIKQRLPIILFIVGISIGSVLYIFQARSIPTISYDDGISYLAVTGHQGIYSQDNLSNQWIPAYKWQAFWQPAKLGVFGKIGRDLAENDIHPPLYFWVLHVWSHMFGISLSTGPLLNGLLHIFTALVIFLVCRLLGCSVWVSATSGILWILNGSILFVATEIRPYSLLALSATCFLASLIYFLRNPSWRSTLFVGMASLIGILTHYHFGIILTISVILTVIYIIRKSSWYHLMQLGVSLFFTGLLFLGLHPKFYLSLIHQQNNIRFLSGDKIPSCISHCLYTVFKAFIPHRYAHPVSLFIVRYWMLLLIISVVANCIILLLKHNQLSKFTSGLLTNFKWFPLLCMSMTLLVIWILYCIGMSPVHAMKPKYLMLVYPLIFIILGQLINIIINKWKMHPITIFLLLVIYQVTYGSPPTLRYKNNLQKQEIDFIKKIKSPLILDSIGRGVLPPTLWHIPTQTLVYATSQKDILIQFPPLPKQETLYYISSLRYSNTIKNRQAILNEFKKREYKIIELKDSIVGDSKIYKLIKSTQQTY